MQKGELPIEWASVLDQVALARPELAASATTSADISVRGFRRLMAVIDRVPAPASRFLRRLALGDWLRALTEKERIEALEALKRLVDSGEDSAAAVGMDLILMWDHRDKAVIKSKLASVALLLAGSPGVTESQDDTYNWQQVLKALSPIYPREVCRLITDFITAPGNVAKLLDQEIVQIIASVAAIDAQGVMQVVGDALLDRKRRAIFGITVIPGFFEAIGLKSVSEWVNAQSSDVLPWLARHFQSPYLDKDNKPCLPPLTEWLFREHEGNQKAFEWFCMGRGTRAFTESEVDPVRKRAQMQPFLSHELRRVREWAEYEIHTEEKDAEFFRELHEEDDRR
jgi:hypothetical protein